MKLIIYYIYKKIQNYFQIILILMKILFRANYTYTIFFGSFLIKSIHKVSSFFFNILWNFMEIFYNKMIEY